MRSSSPKSISMVTCARTFSLPATGSKIACTRLDRAPSSSATYFSCVLSKPTERCGLGASKLPSESTIVTLAGPRLGTEEPTRFAIAPTCWLSKNRPGCMVTTTEAVGFSCSRIKAVCLGMANITRADFTCDNELMLLANSPSSPRW